MKKSTGRDTRKGKKKGTRDIAAMGVEKGKQRYKGMPEQSL